ncbi:MAG: hypothetical protein AAF290_00085 [Pseudomonadota bacterium]
MTVTKIAMTLLVLVVAMLLGAVAFLERNPSFAGAVYGGDSIPPSDMDQCGIDKYFIQISRAGSYLMDGYELTLPAVQARLGSQCSKALGRCELVISASNEAPASSFTSLVNAIEIDGECVKVRVDEI